MILGLCTSTLRVGRGSGQRPLSAESERFSLRPCGGGSGPRSGAGAQDLAGPRGTWRAGDLAYVPGRLGVPWLVFTDPDDLPVTVVLRGP